MRQPDTFAGTSAALSGDILAAAPTGSCCVSRYVGRLCPLVRQLVRQQVRQPFMSTGTSTFASAGTSLRVVGVFCLAGDNLKKTGVTLL